VTDFPGQADLVRECKSGLVIDSNNPHQLAEAVNFLAQNPEEAHLMGKMDVGLLRKIILGKSKPKRHRSCLKD